MSKKLVDFLFVITILFVDVIVIGVILSLASSKSKTFSKILPPSNSFASTAVTLQVGVNAESIIDYGYSDLKPDAPASDIDADLAEIQRMKGSIVRVFVGDCLVSDTESANRLDAFLTKAASYNIEVIPTLIDLYGSCHNNEATGMYYTRIWNNLHLLSDQFFVNGYQTSFKPFVQTVVTQNKSHANIYAWEIGNELKDETDTQGFISFMQDMSSYIKSIDPNHKVATGMMYAAHTALTPATLYPLLPDIDVITVHSYNFDHTGTADLDWAAQNGKIGIVEEEGFSTPTDRSTNMATEISYFQSHGTQALLQWGFIAKGLADNGDGDGTYGMDTIWHTDYDALFSVLSNGVPSSGGCSGNACTDCILANRPDILNFYQQNGWDISCSNQQNVVNNWCSSVDPNSCSSLKTSTCAVQCGMITPSPTPVPVLGGKNFQLMSENNGSIPLTWSSGTVQTGFIILRQDSTTSSTTLLPPSTTLPATATTYTDTTVQPGDFYCYLVLPVSQTDVLGNSDILCVIPGSHSGTSIPQNFALQLDQSTTANMSWIGAGGQTGYELIVIPTAAGATTQYIQIGGTATNTNYNSQGATLCYTIASMNGSTLLGYSDILCAIPNKAALAYAQGTEKTQVLGDATKVSSNSNSRRGKLDVTKSEQRLANVVTTFIKNNTKTVVLQNLMKAEQKKK